MGFRVKVRQGTFIPGVIDPATKGAEEATKFTREISEDGCGVKCWGEGVPGQLVAGKSPASRGVCDERPL